VIEVGEESSEVVVLYQSGQPIVYDVVVVVVAFSEVKDVSLAEVVLVVLLGKSSTHAVEEISVVVVALIGMGLSSVVVVVR
jgi:hypothetical protein